MTVLQAAKKEKSVGGRWGEKKKRREFLRKTRGSLTVIADEKRKKKGNVAYTIEGRGRDSREKAGNHVQWPKAGIAPITSRRKKGEKKRGNYSGTA